MQNAPLSPVLDVRIVRGERLYLLDPPPSSLTKHPQIAKNYWDVTKGTIILKIQYLQVDDEHIGKGSVERLQRASE